MYNIIFTVKDTKDSRERDVPKSKARSSIYVKDIYIYIYICIHNKMFRFLHIIEELQNYNVREWFRGKDSVR